MPKSKVIIERRVEQIERKDILAEIQELRREFAGHAEEDRAWQKRVEENKASFDRHMEIYANNGKEMARLAENVKNMGAVVEEVKKLITGGDVRSDGYGTDLSALKADVDWLKRLSYIVITANVASLVSAFYSLFKVVR